MSKNWISKYKFAHRGLHNEKYPENSLGAFSNACKMRFGIELDVRLLKDDTIVVFHDTNLKRVCNVDIELKDLTIKDLANYPLQKTKYKIPTLEETLKLIDGNVPIIIELKPIKSKEKLPEKLYNILKDYKGEFAIKSFDPFAVLWFKKHAPEVTRGMLSSYFKNMKMPWLYKIVLKKLWFYKIIKPDFISYDYRDLPNKYIAKREVPILAWTVTSQAIEDDVLRIANNVIFENYIPKEPHNF